MGPPGDAMEGLRSLGLRAEGEASPGTAEGGGDGPQRRRSDPVWAVQALPFQYRERSGSSGPDTSLPEGCR